MALSGIDRCSRPPVGESGVCGDSGMKCPLSRCKTGRHDHVTTCRKCGRPGHAVPECKAINSPELLAWANEGYAAHHRPARVCPLPSARARVIVNSRARPHIAALICMDRLIPPSRYFPHEALWCRMRCASRLSSITLCTFPICETESYCCSFALSGDPPPPKVLPRLWRAASASSTRERPGGAVAV
jgi:hypothetical protein